ncbi:amino acid adenylation domain-containing protein [Serratia rhizosphaerae]|uniref:amino acid adenylation domain-containing protein n=1 Tax=Serratia sp. Tan611 TaxID=2773264 RepID=UPI0019348F68|nr:amino acid adenylation domain-containing protein [Serratia sp. Tan611]CAE1147797.1 Amidophosphoribosyltransferase [Serratia sp. Tan611]
MTNSVQHYLNESAKLFPNKVAVRCRTDEVNEFITYQELDNFTNAFGAYLQRLGVEKGDMVAFYMPKSVSAVKALLSIVKSSAAYIPLDYRTPENRLASILKESDAKIVIVNQYSVDRAVEVFGKLDHRIKIINIDDFSADTSVLPALNDNTISVDLAYVLFTSGSTGTPKGVMIPHGAIVDYIDWCVETYGLTAEDQIANHAPLYFDNSTFDIYTALKTGATLNLVPESVNMMIPRLADWIRDESISIFFCVPSVLSMLQQTGRLHADMFPELKQILCAGEVLPINVLRTWMNLFPHIQFTNMYGPTEITVDCSYHIIDKIPGPEKKHVPIGQPRGNMEMYILTDEGELTQQRGSRGELLVRGYSVAYGYLGNQEKTNESFIQNPKHNKYSDILYKTGDLALIGEDGLFYYSGRKDSQIKHLGYRIELGEIESNVLRLAFVEEAVAIYRTSGENLGSFIGMALKTNQNIEFRALRSALATVLPNYMIPSKFVFITDSFPRTANGKYDRKAISELFSS